MKKRFSILLLMLGIIMPFVLLSASSAQDSHSVLLSKQAAEDLKRLCSRQSPKLDGAWQANTEDIAALESHLSDLNKLSGPGEHLLEDRRQYIAVIVGGRKKIYINGFCAEAFTKWKKDLVSPCDGGHCFWGALYDIETKTFSDLHFNGQA